MDKDFLEINIVNAHFLNFPLIKSSATWAKRGFLLTSDQKIISTTRSQA